MSDMPTDDVEELEAIEVEDEDEETTAPAPSRAKPDTRSTRRQARSASSEPVEPMGLAGAFVSSGAGARSLEFLHGVEMEVTVELGRARRTVRDLLEVQVGSVIELDRSAGSPVDVLVNGMLIARGEVVVVEDEFAVRITEILDSSGLRVSR